MQLSIERVVELLKCGGVIYFFRARYLKERVGHERVVLGVRTVRNLALVAQRVALRLRAYLYETVHLHHFCDKLDAVG